MRAGAEAPPPAAAPPSPQIRVLAPPPRSAAAGPPGGRGGGAREGGPAAPRVTSDDWTLNEEAIANLGYMQMKKTHDAAIVLVERPYGEGPRVNYFIGSSP